MELKPRPHFSRAFIEVAGDVAVVFLILGTIFGLIAMLAGMSNYNHGYDDEVEFREWFLTGAVCFGICAPLLLSLMIRAVRHSRKSRHGQ